MALSHRGVCVCVSILTQRASQLVCEHWGVSMTVMMSLKMQLDCSGMLRLLFTQRKQRIQGNTCLDMTKTCASPDLVKISADKNGVSSLKSAALENERQQSEILTDAAFSATHHFCSSYVPVCEATCHTAAGQHINLKTTKTQQCRINFYLHSKQNSK